MSFSGNNMPTINQIPPQNVNCFVMYTYIALLVNIYCGFFSLKDMQTQRPLRSGGNLMKDAECAE